MEWQMTIIICTGIVCGSIVLSFLLIALTLGNYMSYKYETEPRHTPRNDWYFSKTEKNLEDLGLEEEDFEDEEEY